MEVKIYYVSSQIYFGASYSNGSNAQLLEVQVVSLDSGSFVWLVEVKIVSQ